MPLTKVALTGGIATGKSHVLARIERAGVPTIDADRLARTAVEPGTAGYRAVLDRFGPDVVTPEGGIDRRRLGALVFGDPDARRDLEAIVHPAVYRAITEWMATVEASGRHEIAVADIPLLFETGHAEDFDRVIVTVCSPETQIHRIVARDRISADEARRRIAAQWPIGEKAARADFVIDTSGSFESTDQQVVRVLAELRAAPSHPAENRSGREEERGER